MVLLSQFPIDTSAARTFQHFLWQDMPGALLPIDPHTQQSWYSEADLRVFRLSSKSHWDVPVDVPVESPPQTSDTGLTSPGQGQRLQQKGGASAVEMEVGSVQTAEQETLDSRYHDQDHGLEEGVLGESSRVQVHSKRVHLLLHHPTPPAFDGPEMRNVMRNHDEIRLWADYIGCGLCMAATNDAGYLYDDQGHTGGIATGKYMPVTCLAAHKLLRACWQQRHQTPARPLTQCSWHLKQRRP